MAGCQLCYFSAIQHMPVAVALLLEYLAAGSTVAVGWSGYFADFMRSIGLPLPAAFSSAPIALTGVHGVALTGAVVNLAVTGIWPTTWYRRRSSRPSATGGGYSGPTTRTPTSNAS